MQFAWLEFTSDLLFTGYPQLDSVLRTHAGGCDIAVPGQGVWRVRPHGTGATRKFVYTNKMGTWDVVFTGRKPCSLLR